MFGAHAAAGTAAETGAITGAETDGNIGVKISFGPVAGPESSAGKGAQRQTWCR